jgi:2-oxoglutarate ferredoxin oxidoreductase subunit delta
MSKTGNSVVVRTEYCKGCTLCVEFCKKGVLRVSEKLNRQGYYYIEPVEGAECTGCMVCTLVCPDLALEVYSE